MIFMMATVLIASSSRMSLSHLIDEKPVLDASLDQSMLMSA